MYLLKHIQAIWKNLSKYYCLEETQCENVYIYFFAICKKYSINCDLIMYIILGSKDAFSLWFYNMDSSDNY